MTTTGSNYGGRAYDTLYDEIVGDYGSTLGSAVGVLIVMKVKGGKTPSAMTSVSVLGGVILGSLIGKMIQVKMTR
jgi:mannose/fructose/N-acetylgalactosamine-specific phosphotransferase system component IID